MKNLILRWIILAVSVIGASMITQLLGLGFKVEFGTIERVGQLFVGVAILALLNATLGKVLKLLTIPLNCMTLGLFSLVINAAMLYMAASTGFGMTITGQGAGAFVSAFVASIIISVINGSLSSVLKEDKDDDE